MSRSVGFGDFVAEADRGVVALGLLATVRGARLVRERRSACIPLPRAAYRIAYLARVLFKIAE